MDPFTAIQSTLGGIKSAMEISAKISDASDAIKQADLRLQLAELTESLAEARIKLSQVKIAISDKDEEINELKMALEMKEKLIFNENYGLFELEEDGKIIRYCMNCHADGKFIPVQETKSSFECKRCNQKYYRPEYRPSRSKRSKVLY